VKKYFIHTISVLLLAVFLFNGVTSLLPLFSIGANKQDIEELLTKTESENSGKEKEEKVPEKEWIHHAMDIEFPALVITNGKKTVPGQPASWKNIFLTVLAPPPELIYFT
jgi:hypothetical protein